MSEQETLPEKRQDSAAEAQDGEQDAAASVKRGGKVVLLVIVASFAWYLAADRFTPRRPPFDSSIFSTSPR